MKEEERKEIAVKNLEYFINQIKTGAIILENFMTNKIAEEFPIDGYTTWGCTGYKSLKIAIYKSEKDSEQEGGEKTQRKKVGAGAE